MNKSDLLLFTLFGILFFSCHKYPDNDLWFEDPEKTIEATFKITGFKVNDVDCLAYLNTKLPSNISTFDWHFNGHYNGNQKRFHSTNPNVNAGADSDYSFKNDYKELDINFLTTGFIYPEAKFIFLEKESVWKILKLQKQETENTILHIKRDFNGKTYDLQFN